MADLTIARRWARAFLDVADEANAIDRLGADLDKVVEAARANDSQLLRALSNPVFSVEERRAVLKAILPRLGVHPLTSNMMMLLLDKGRFAALPEIQAVYSTISDERAGRARVLVETAEPLGPQLEAEVRAALARVTGKEVVLETRVNPDLIGGIVARVGDKVYDASVRARLQDIKQRLSRAQLTFPTGTGLAEA